MADITVGWCPIDAELGLLQLIEEPQSLYDKYLKGTKYRHLNCPATMDIYKNTFVVTSPFDCFFELDIENRQLHLFNKSKNFSEDFFHMREGEYGEKDDPLMSLKYHLLFMAEEDDIEMMMTAPYFEPKQNKLRIIPGKMNISKWWRPTDLAFQLNSRKESIKIKRGDPLFYVTFIPKTTGSFINLKEVELTKELKDYIESTVNMKWFAPRCPLSKLYSIADKFRKKGKRPKLKFL